MGGAGGGAGIPPLLCPPCPIAVCGHWAPQWGEMGRIPLCAVGGHLGVLGGGGLSLCGLGVGALLGWDL